MEIPKPTIFPARAVEGCSQSTASFAKGINAVIDEAKDRVLGVEADDSHTPPEKSVFATSYKKQIEPKIDAMLNAAINNLEAAKGKLEAEIAKPPELSVHAAILLGQKLKETSAIKMPELVTDPAYVGLLKELPASYFGITEDFHAELLRIARATTLTDARIEQGKTLEADQAQIDFLKERRDVLLRRLEGLLLSDRDQKSRGRNAHLYG